jgi:hypothetical protein
MGSKSYSLSDGDIRKLLGQDISIITYPELKHLQSADDMFDDKGRCILLFLTENDHSGHWLALIKRGQTIEFFDPYGEAPEDQKDNVPEANLERLDESQPYLTDLIKASGYKTVYNHFGYQKDKAGINTCGRHCAVRLLNKDLPLPKYKTMIQNSGLSPDDYVTKATYAILNK